MKPAIVILVPCYNSAATISETLLSVLNQGAALSRVQAIYLADDCSTDATIQTATEIWRGPVPLNVIRRSQNAGERTNLNEAIGRLPAEVRWFFILHSDDVAKPNWLRAMIERIDLCSPNVASICSGWDDLMPDGSVKAGENDPQRAFELIQGNDASVRGTLLRGCWWHISGCAIRREAMVGIGGFHPRLPQKGDWEWLLRCLKGGWGVEYIPKALILYRNHPASVSSVSFQMDKDIRETLVILKDYYAILSRVDMLRIHSASAERCLRRVARAALRGRLRRLLRAFETLVLVMVSFFKANLAARPARFRWEQPKAPGGKMV